MKIKFTAEVNVKKVGGKAGFLSYAMVRSGNLIVATATLAGKFTPQTALAEFTKNPKRFNFAPKFANLTPEQVRALAAA